MGPRTFHILYNGLGLLQGVAHGTNDNSSRCNGFGYLVLIPVKTVGISPFLTVNQGILVHSAHVVHPETIGEDSRFIEDLGFNSYDFMSMVGEIEEKFDVEVEEREVVNVKTVKDAADYIQSLQAE